MRIKRIIETLGAAVALTAASAGASGQTVRSLAPDIAFHMLCRDIAVQTVEKAVETFLEREGFRVLNLARTQHEHEIHLFDLRIIGLDTKRRMVEFLALPAENRYAVRLNTEPPTRSSVELEQHLESFPAASLHCEVRQLARHENPSEARDMFDSEVNRVESLFRQADALKGKHSL